MMRRTVWVTRFGQAAGALGLLLMVAAGCGQSERSRSHRAGEQPASATPSSAASHPALRAPQRYLKGQLHAHTGRSGDSQTPPGDVVGWYAAHGFDFVVLTDHNVITREPGVDDMLVFPGVELTQNLRRCTPPPETRAGCLLHVNALMVTDAQAEVVRLPPAEGRPRVDVYSDSLALSRQLGAIAQLNHPNFHYSADAPLIAELAKRGLVLLEVANEAVDSNNAGDARHPSTEALWDQVLTRGATVWAVATDDAHHYDDAERLRARGQPVFTGDRGFVMVRAAREPAAIRAALVRGDFYSSSGVLLERVVRADGVLEVEVAGEYEYDIAFIGSGGRVLARERGTRGRYALKDSDSRYVRAVITHSAGARAWTQPLMAGE